MEKKKGRKKKIRFNYFLEKKIIIGICLFLVIVVGITTVLVITNKEDKELESNQNEVEKVIPAKCPYTLDEIEERITTNWLFSNEAFTNYREDATSFALVLLNFYKYFNKETGFIVWDEVDANTWEPISYKKISYDQYQDYIQTSLNSCDITLQSGGTGWGCVSSLRLFMLHDAKFVEK